MAGCLGGEDPQAAEDASSDEAAGGAGGPANVTMSDCRQQRARFAFPADQLPPIPPGFEPAPFPGDPAGETARVVTFASTCREASLEGASNSTRALLTLAVEPPEALAGEAVDRHYLAFAGATTSPAMAEAYEAWGLPQVQAGNASLALETTPAAETGHAEAGNGSMAFAVDTAVAGPAEAPAEGTVRFFGSDGTVVTGALDQTFTDKSRRGPGHAELEIAFPVPPEGQSHHASGVQRTLTPAPGLNLSASDPGAPHVTNATDLSARTVHTGFSGAEPTLGVLPSGAVFVQAMDDTLRSENGGHSWGPVYTYEFDEVGGTDGSHDPFLWVDRDTDRVYFSHIRHDRLGDPGQRCIVVGWTADGGKSWSRNDQACGLPKVDYQKLGGGPPGPDANPPAGAAHPTVLYLCYRQPYGPQCLVSYDGGETWPVESALAGAGIGGGRPVVAGDGTAFVPTGDGISVSTDSGLTWEGRDGPQGLWLKEVALAPDGILYALGLRDGVAHLARSSDRGDTWTDAWRVSPPGIDTNAFYSMAVGEGGRLGVAMVGTNRSLEDPGAAPADARWHLYTAVATDADTENPTFRATRATEDPVQVGPICLKGTRCEDARNLLEFIDATAAPDGTFYTVFADGCTGGCATAEDPEPAESRDDEATLAWVEGFSLAAEPAGGVVG